MNINIPDKLYKLLALIGLILIGYSIYNIDFVEKKYFSEIYDHRKIRDSLLLTEMIIKNKKETLIKIANSLSIKYDTENPVTYTDSTLSFTRILNGQKNELTVSDSLDNLWNDYLNFSFKMDLINKKLSFSEKYLEEKEKLKKQYFDNYDEIKNFGIFLFILGIILWSVDTPSNKKENKILKQQDKLYPFCQSCGEKFTSILKYGTNKDKSENYAFCRNCFKKGKFTNPDLTKEELIKNSMELNHNKNWLIKKLLKNSFNDLERWNNDKY